MTNKNQIERRSFIRSAGAAATIPLIVPGIVSANVLAEETLTIGLIGCGGRGTGAAWNALEAGTNVKLVAMGDLFEDKLQASRRNLQKKDASRASVPDESCFVGFDAFRKVIATDCDIVILATPPGFRPQHFQAAVAAGKNVFMEKPVAVDATGIRMIMEGAALAKRNKQSVVAGTQRRHEKSYLEAMKRIHGGEIGDVVAGRCYWNMGGLWNVKAEGNRTDAENQIRNWLYYTWLSGDHICEQHIHNLDVMNWAMESTPEYVFGVGGRQSRTGENYGHIFDHFGLEYGYPDDRFAMSMCRQQVGTKGKVEEIITGTKGVARLSGGRARLTGPTPWRFSGGQTNPYIQEHKDLQASIRGTGSYLNEGQRVAESTLTAIMGREAAYTGKMITWDDALNSDQDLMPEIEAFATMGQPGVAVPGRTKMDRSDDTRGAS